MPHLRILVDPFPGQRILRVFDDRRLKEVAEHVTGHLLHDWERAISDTVLWLEPHLLHAVVTDVADVGFHLISSCRCCKRARRTKLFEEPVSFF